MVDCAWLVALTDPFFTLVSGNATFLRARLVFAILSAGADEFDDGYFGVIVVAVVAEK